MACLSFLAPRGIGRAGDPGADYTCSGEVNSPCAKIFAAGKNACLGKAQIGAYSKMIPDASQAAMVSSSHRDTCTSPIWALCPSGQGRMGSRTDLNARAK